MEQSIEHRTDSGDIAEQLAPIFDGTIASHAQPLPKTGLPLW
jgi:hypothetical protein